MRLKFKKAMEHKHRDLISALALKAKSSFDKVLQALVFLARYLTLAAEFEAALADGNFFVCVLL